MRNFFKRNRSGESLKQNEINVTRRNFIKFALFGAGVLATDRLVKSLPFLQEETILNSSTVGNFKVTETGAHYAVSSEGREILIIEKNN